MFTKDNLHHARIEDIVSDLLSRIETLESNRQEIQSTMQNDLENVSLKSENNQLKNLTQFFAKLKPYKSHTIEDAIDLIVSNGETPTVSSMEGHDEMIQRIRSLESENERLQNLVKHANDKHNMFALKDKNERLEKWDKEHREKIETLAIELNASEKLVRSLQFQNDNFRKINQNFKRTLEDLAQWKNSVKDGLPKIEIGTVIVFQFSGDTGYDKWDFLESDDIDGFNTYISQRQIGYYIIIKIDNAAN